MKVKLKQWLSYVKKKLKQKSLHTYLNKDYKCQLFEILSRISATIISMYQLFFRTWFIDFNLKTNVGVRSVFTAYSILYAA